jgi:hypothetical protein
MVKPDYFMARFWILAMSLPFKAQLSRNSNRPFVTPSTIILSFAPSVEKSQTDLFLESSWFGSTLDFTGGCMSRQNVSGNLSIGSSRIGFRSQPEPHSGRLPPTDEGTGAVHLRAEGNDSGSGRCLGQSPGQRLGQWSKFEGDVALLMMAAAAAGS